MLQLPLLLTLLAVGADANWPHFRGPHYNGVSDAISTPTTFSPEKNVKWVADLPGESASTPVVWGEHIFVSMQRDKDRRLLAICLDRGTGKVKWETECGRGEKKNAYGNNTASPSPVTDGKHVVFTFGTGELHCFDFDGKPLWKRHIREKGTIKWGYSSTPMIYDGKVYAMVLQTGPSYLIALDVATGKPAFKTQRKPSGTKAEQPHSYASPTLYEGEDGPQILLAGGDCFTGHDPQTGQELWRWAHYNRINAPFNRVVVSPTPGRNGSGVIFAGGPRGQPFYAVRADRKGDRPEDDAVWVMKKNPPDVPCALLYDGRLYVVGDSRGVMTCLKPDTGEVIYSERIGTRAPIRASPTAADGNIYIIDMEGNTFVLAAGDAFKVLHKTDMTRGNRCWSTIVPLQNQLLIRTEDKLYCIEESAE